MNGDKIEKIFKECGAIKEGHFELSRSQLHSPTYFEKALLYEKPKVFEKLCLLIAQEVSIRPVKIDAVVGPVPFGAALAWRVAYHLGEISQKEVNAIFTEKDWFFLIPPDVEELLLDESSEKLDKIRLKYGLTRKTVKEGGYLFRKSFQKSVAGKNILLVDDVLTTGGSITELMLAVTRLKGKVVAIAVICNRGGYGPERFFGLPVISLYKMKLKTSLKEECLLCQAGVPVDTKF